MWHHSEHGDDTHPPIDVLHIVGRTRMRPYKHFYRTRIDGAYWTPWEPIDLDIDAEQVILVVDDRRPHLFCVDVEINGLPRRPVGAVDPRPIEVLVRLHPRAADDMQQVNRHMRVVAVLFL